jgi:hypothetical protein
MLTSAALWRGAPTTCAVFTQPLRFFDGESVAIKEEVAEQSQ